MLSKLVITLPTAGIYMISQFATLLAVSFLVHVQTESQSFASVFPFTWTPLISLSSPLFLLGSDIVLFYCADFFYVPKACRSEKTLEGCPSCWERMDWSIFWAHPYCELLWNLIFWSSQASCKGKCPYLACRQFLLSLPLPYMCRWLCLGCVCILVTHLLISM